MGTTVRHLNTHWHTGLLTLIISFFVLTNGQANTQDPDVLIKDATHKMITSINQHRAEIIVNPEKLKSLVEEIIIPHIDIITASKWVMGKYWRRADKAQKIQFIKAFRTLLLRFYSSALAEYLKTNDKDLELDLITYHPIREDLTTKDITVRGIVKQDKGEPVSIHYSMHLKKKGWQIYDISVEGVSMITTYKNNFATELKTKGVDGLIASIEEKNKNLLADNSKNKNDKNVKN